MRLTLISADSVTILEVCLTCAMNDPEGGKGVVGCDIFAQLNETLLFGRDGSENKKRRKKGKSKGGREIYANIG